LTAKTRHRLKIEYVDPHTLKPWKGNPRVMSPEDHKKLKTGMREFGDIVEGGIVDPLIVRRRDNLVIGGHQRLEDVLKLGLPRVPIVRIDISDRRMKALNVALNKIHGDWDEDKLASILAELKDLPEVNLTGFDPAEIEKIIADADIPAPDLERAESNGPRLSLLPYMGGKQNLVPRLIPLIPDHATYVEVFGGGAALLLNKPPSKIEVYNDIDGEVVNLFETVRDKPDAFLKRAEFLLYSRELNERWKTDLKNGKVPMDPVERALRFWYLMRSSFAAHPYKGWAFCETADRNRAESIWNALIDLGPIHERLKLVEIDHLDFERLIKNRDSAETFFFLDPPYLGAEDYRMGVFTLADYQRLLKALQGCKGKWLMTTGDHPDVRRLFEEYGTIQTHTRQSVSKVLNGGERPDLPHLLIANYPLHQEALQVAQG
jgi:DNA adenine methylase